MKIKGKLCDGIYLLIKTKNPKVLKLTGENKN